MATTEEAAPAPGSSAVERAAVPVCREVGARVTTNTLISQLNIPSLQRVDNRRTEVIANGFPLSQGARAQLAVDTTLVPPFTAAGQLCRHRGNNAGAALAETRRAKERTYPELAQSGRCRLVVRGVETGGRFSTETTTFLRLVAKARSHDAPPVLRTMARSAWITRWSALLAHAAHQAFAASLLLEDTASTANIDRYPRPPGSPSPPDGLAVWTCVFPSAVPVDFWVPPSRFWPLDLAPCHGWCQKATYGLTQ